MTETYGDLYRIGVADKRDLCFEILTLNDCSNKDWTIHGITGGDESAIR
jgi:hypothetical protein